jgi:myo-inositol 2-dehydrogenase/D-chiro-inositol 1-dehydrogenase
VIKSPAIPATNASDASPSRREFLTQLTVAAAAIQAAGGVHSEAAETESTSALEEVRFGLVGAGGRGSGAVIDSLSINKNIVLSAIADFDTNAAGRLESGLKKRFESAINVPSDKMYSGLDGYKQILDDPSIDLVLFATPPGFRPGHLMDTVDAGKHLFAEKPTCVDPAGYRICLAAHAKAVEKQTSIVTGTQYRRQSNYIEAISRIRDGAIGDIVGATSRYCSNGIWYRNRPEGMADTEYQIRNWMHFIWLSGDQITEQAVHNIDFMNWLMDSTPESAFGSGGRFTRPEDSEMWDSMSIDYVYPGNRFISFKCRQIPGVAPENGTVIYGSNGSAKVLGTNSGSFIYDKEGKEVWTMKGNIGAAYQQEHKDLVDSIRSGTPIVELQETANSSLTAIMGRLAAYTGQKVTWDFLVNESKLDLFPKPLDLTAARESSVAVPGRTQLI